jgi:predicted ribosome quality control (RQC) complex YloA/Tae2 family protein
LDIQTLHREIEITKDDFKNSKGEFWKLNPTYGSMVKKYLIEIGYEDKSPDEQWTTYKEINSRLHISEFYCINEDLPTFSLLPFSDHKPLGNDPISAINKFFILFNKAKNVLDEKKKLQTLIQKHKLKTEKYIENSKSTLEKLQRKTSYREIGDLIMANMHAISAHQKEVELHNFYSNENITIKLNPNLSPQKNAENYYRKSKNQHKEIEKLNQALKSNILI